ncbi:MAG: CarD family transcriptional regulator [Myxococcota bacterium]
MQTTLRIGDKVVYPAHGVGEVTAIERREISGFDQTFYVLSIMNTGMTVLVPTNNARSTGMREVIDASQVNSVFRTLRRKASKMPKVTWNRKQREYTEKIKAGSIHGVAEVFRELSLIGANKELSFSERKLLDTVRGLLVTEIACAKACPAEEVQLKMDAIFAKYRSAEAA